MQVSKHKVVSIDYTLKGDDGEVIDSSQGGEPLSYLHGEGNIIPGLERALDGKAQGDELQVSIDPADGYGERVEELRQIVSREDFGDVDLKIGMQFRVSTEDNVDMIVEIVEIEDDRVTIDGNHALAGMTLHFDVTIQEIRDATKEEIEHGHAHHAGGHC